jgi:hypothetical protein
VRGLGGSSLCLLDHVYVEIIPAPTGFGMKNKITNIEMLSVPIFGNFSFWNFFY